MTVLDAPEKYRPSELFWWLCLYSWLMIALLLIGAVMQAAVPKGHSEYPQAVGFVLLAAWPGLLGLLVFCALRWRQMSLLHRFASLAPTVVALALVAAFPI
jgi:hypothetical protein